MPFLAGRIDANTRNAVDRMLQGFIHEAKRFYYDTAGAPNRGALVSLLQLVEPSQVLFGTDFPPGGASLEIARALADTGVFDAAALRAVNRDNALKLVPRLRGVAADRKSTRLNSSHRT